MKQFIVPVEVTIKIGVIIEAQDQASETIMPKIGPIIHSLKTVKPDDKIAGFTITNWEVKDRDEIEESFYEVT